MTLSRTTDMNIPHTSTTFDTGLVFERDVALTMSDGVVLRANVFRPQAPGRYPVVMAMGAYGKDVHFEVKMVVKTDFVNWVLSLAPDLVPLKPDSLRREVADRLQRGLDALNA